MLIFVGLGLYDEKGISLRGLEEIQKSHRVFAEFYTSLMSGLSLSKLEALIGKQVKVLSRKEIEEEAENIILTAARDGIVSLLVPGDPMTATTHVDLRLRAEKRGVSTRVIHAASIGTAVSGATGLQSYKFGRTITVPFIRDRDLPESIYDYCKKNIECGLHTLILLDVDDEERRFMSIPEALQILSELERKRREKIFLDDRLMIGVARLGSIDAMVKADRLNRVSEFNFGEVPHCLVAPGKLHFMEREALKILAGASEDVIRSE